MFIGMDHGSRAIRLAILDGDFQTFEIKRGEDGAIIERLSQHCDIREIELLALGYSMGDGFAEIRNVRSLHDRGMKSSSGAGEFIGTGTRIFDEIVESEIPAIAIPGLHRDCSLLDNRFRELYPHIASPDKVCAAYHALNVLGPGKTFVLADVSYNTVSVAVREGNIIGGIDATFGAPGIIQGPIGLDGIRRIDSGGITANQSFSTGGIANDQETYEDFIARLKSGEGDAERNMDSLALAVAMEIASLRVFMLGLDIIVLTGEVGCMTEPYDFQDKVGCFFDEPIIVLDRYSAAKGAAEIAKSVFNGKKDIMGIPINY